jgi:hypothetical protein
MRCDKSFSAVLPKSEFWRKHVSPIYDVDQISATDVSTASRVFGASRVVSFPAPRVARRDVRSGCFRGWRHRATRRGAAKA